jgi:hypothetical protein
MTTDIFRTINELLDSSDCVLTGNAVCSDGSLYEDSKENLNAFRMLEPSLYELVSVCIASGMDNKALREVIELTGWQGMEQ